MKLKIFFVVSLFTYAVISSGCATIMKGGEGDLYLLNAPKDIEIYEDGEKLDIDFLQDTEAYGFGDSFSDEMNNTSTTYYSYGVTLQDLSKERQLVLNSESLGKQTTVNIETRGPRWFWLFANMGPIGWVIDAVTGNWNDFAGEGDDTKYLDVMKHLNKNLETSDTE